MQKAIQKQSRLSILTFQIELSRKHFHSLQKCQSFASFDLAFYCYRAVNEILPLIYRVVVLAVFVLSKEFNADTGNTCLQTITLKMAD